MLRCSESTIETLRNREEVYRNDGELGKNVPYASARGNLPTFYDADISFSTENVHVLRRGGNEIKMSSKTR